MNEQPRDVDSGLVVQMHPIEERRGTPRIAIELRATATFPGAKEAALGVTVDVSVGGLCLHMPVRPSAALQDITVRDSVGDALVWGRVLSNVETADGRQRWHVQITAADDNWEALVRRCQEADSVGPAPAAMAQ